ncbi:MAG TPA: hypothetical protein VMP08_12775 [Anaerolineae bacterium]|nr:hypothetical protein [Anaerolineae bacterium]
MSADFEHLLVEHVAPRLLPQGYVYDPGLRLGEELYGFRKELGDDIHAIIQFRYRQDAARHDFTVNLCTAKSNEIQPRLYGGYPGARGARLSYVMWFVYELRDYAVPDYWWVAPDAAYLPAALEEAAGYIVCYGLPWLENAQASRPWEMPSSRTDEFSEAVQAVMGHEMERLGYQLKRQALSGNLPYCYFSKALPDGTFALIELQAIYSLDPNEFNFDVRLQRRADGDPLAFDGNYAHWRSISLAQLVRQVRGGAPLDRLPISDVKTLFWHYHDRAELAAQLIDALEQIRQIGCVWVEQAPESKMIQ